MNLILGGRGEESGNLILLGNLFCFGAIVTEAVFPVLGAFGREDKSRSGDIKTNAARPGNPVPPPLWSENKIRPEHWVQCLCWEEG